MDRMTEELRRARTQARDEIAMLGRVRTIARRAVARKSDWLLPTMCIPDPEQGFGAYLLHEEADHTLAVFVVNWLPGRGTPPHDHGTWAVIAGIDGAERNIFWKRIESPAGLAGIAKAGERALGPGDIVALGSDTIHSVVNDGDRLSLSLHIYGRHFNHTQRSRFDPVAGIEFPYRVAVSNEPAHPQQPAEVT